MKKLLKLFLCVFLVLPCMSLWAFDFGLILDQSPSFSGSGSDSTFDYQGVLIPRFSALLGDNGRIYISAGVNLHNNPWIVVPELLRTEFSWRFNSGELKLGRIQYSDPVGLVADGLFDGAQFSFDTEAGVFSVGAWYTGLLYKKRTEITMTREEGESYLTDLKYSDFSDTYFAAKRFIAALGWEHPGLKEVLRAKITVLTQFDLSGTDLHSQYAIGKFSLPMGNFIFDLGGSLELIEDSSDVSVGLAGELGVTWMLPTAIEDRIMLLGRFSSGTFEGSNMRAFLPITTSYQGSVLKGKLSGLSMISLDYLARLHQTFSAGISSSYFIRSDKGTFTLLGNDGWFLGNEFFGRVLWSPVSDLQINLGGGVFLPRLGNAAPDSDVLWRVELSVVLSLY